jgi:hypothetical protein
MQVFYNKNGSHCYIQNIFEPQYVKRLERFDSLSRYNIDVT